MEYRLYCLDETQHIIVARGIVVLDDLAALREAEALCEEHAIEIWQGTRRVAHVAKGGAAQEAPEHISLY